jgi:hypothetical protein
MKFSMGIMWGCLAVLGLVAIIAVAGASGAFAIPCVLMMGVMMWMMMRGMGGRSSPSASAAETAPRPKAPAVRDLDAPLVTSERPLEILERRFAAGEISVEDYQTRREALISGAAERNGAHKDELLTAPGGEGRQ